MTEKKDGAKLTPGKKTNKDLAEFFGVRPQSYSNKKKDFLKKLEEYAVFEINDAGKVNILEVIEPYYVNERAVETIQEYVPLCWSENGYDICPSVGDRIIDRIKAEKPTSTAANLKRSTVITYTRMGRMELFGAPNPLNEKHWGGSLGYCQYAWCKKEENGTFTPLTPEQDQIRRELFGKLFGSGEDVQNKYEFIISAIANNVNDEDGTDERAQRVALEAIELAAGLDKNQISDVWFVYKTTLEQIFNFPLYQCTKITRYATPEEKLERKRKALSLDF